MRGSRKITTRAGSSRRDGHTKLIGTARDPLNRIAEPEEIGNPAPFDFNKQCVAEGLANLVGGFFRCLPGSGSLSRSAINYQAGAVTRFSGIIVRLQSPLRYSRSLLWLRFVPKPALAALLLLTAARLIEPKRIAYTIRASGLDAGVLALTAVTGLASVSTRPF